MILTRIDPDRNMARYYRLEVQPDLFGGAVLVRNWGRIGAPGQERREWFSSWFDARAAQQRLQQIKARRGYQPRPALPC